MVNPVQPVRSPRTEPTRIEPAADRAPLASTAVTGPAAPPPLSPPATIVELSDAVFARQRGVNPGKGRGEGRQQRRIATADEARIETATTRRSLLGDPALAARAQAHVPAERVYGLLFDQP
jgi:hypothetical protein